MTTPTPPTADIRPQELTIHGHTRIDNYYWLREKSSQDVLNFPIRLTDKLLNVLGGMNRAEFGPTQGQREVANALDVTPD